jgi:hypothetical protein
MLLFAEVFLNSCYQALKNVEIAQFFLVFNWYQISINV